MKKQIGLITILIALLTLNGCGETENKTKNDTESKTSELGSSYKMETRDTRIGKLSFENGYPDHETLEALYDERDFQRACQAYQWSLPIVSMMEFIHSYQEDLGAKFGDLCHIKDMMMQVMVSLQMQPQSICSDGMT